MFFAAGLENLANFTTCDQTQTCVLRTPARDSGTRVLSLPAASSLLRVLCSQSRHKSFRELLLLLLLLSAAAAANVAVVVVVIVVVVVLTFLLLQFVFIHVQNAFLLCVGYYSFTSF